MERGLLLPGMTFPAFGLVTLRSTIECVTIPHRCTSGQGAAESSVGPAERINQPTLRPELLFPSLSGQALPGPPGPCPGFRQTRSLLFPSRPWERPSHRLSTGVGENQHLGENEGMRPKMWGLPRERPDLPRITCLVTQGFSLARALLFASVTWYHVPHP